jgi:NAD(P)-dependent dehydrogenase (short-subunit alcohol dehydrogenase family)
MTTDGRTVLITGSTDGVGRHVAERLGEGGAVVLVHGRDRDRAEAVLATIRGAGGSGAFYPADFSSLAEVRTLAEAVARDHGRLDVLVNNAGIGVGRRSEGRLISRDRHELRFAVNYLAGFLLTRLLLPLLKASPAARIVNVSSVGQQKIDFADVMLTKGYTGPRAYCQSKLAQIMFTFDLAQELQPSSVTANCLHPATYMNTTMVRRDGVTPMSTVDEGARAILQLIVSPDLAGKTGLYFNGLLPHRADGQAYDTAVRGRLRTLSFQLAGLPEPTPARL